MFEITLLTLLTSYKAFEDFCFCNFSAKNVFRIAKLKKLLRAEKESFDETNRALIKKFGQELDNGRIEVLPEYIPEYTKQLEELAAQKINIPFDLLSIEDFPEIMISADIMDKISWLFKDI